MLRRGDHRGGAAHLCRFDLGIGDGVDAGELQRAEKAAGQENRDHAGKWHALHEACAGRQKRAADQRIVKQHVAIAETAQNAGHRRLHEHRTERGGKGDEPGFKRRQSKADLQQERQQKRQRADAEPKQKPAEDAGAKGRQSEQTKIKNWRRRPPGMDQIGDSGNRAAAQQ